MNTSFLILLVFPVLSKNETLRELFQEVPQKQPEDILKSDHQEISGNIPKEAVTAQGKQEQTQEKLALDETPPKLSVTKGQHKSCTNNGRDIARKYPSFDLCILDILTLNVKVVKYDCLSRNANRLSLIIRFYKNDKQTEKESKLVATYEVEKIISHQELGDSYQTEIQNMGICNSFQLMEFEVNSITYHIIQFYHHEDLWCDVYTDASFNHKNVDLCDEVQDDLVLLNNNISADKPSESELSTVWSGCIGLKQIDVCDTPDHLAVKAIPMCASSHQVKYYLVTYFYGYSLGTYTVSNMPGLESFSGLCALFRFKIDGNKQENVTVQYFKNGEWKCQLFERAIDDGVVRFKKQMLWGPCLRFKSERKIKPVNHGRFLPAGSKVYKALNIIKHMKILKRFG